MAQSADSFSVLNYVDPTPSRSADRWDAAEASSYFNFNDGHGRLGGFCLARRTPRKAHDGGDSIINSVVPRFGNSRRASAFEA